MNKYTRSLSAVALLAFSLAALAGCNTISGAGKDVQKAGEVVEETAEDAKN